MLSKWSNVPLARWTAFCQANSRPHRVNEIFGWRIEVKLVVNLAIEPSNKRSRSSGFPIRMCQPLDSYFSRSIKQFLGIQIVAKPLFTIKGYANISRIGTLAKTRTQVGHFQNSNLAKASSGISLQPKMDISPPFINTSQIYKLS